MGCFTHITMILMKSIVLPPGNHGYLLVLPKSEWKLICLHSHIIPVEAVAHNNVEATLVHYPVLNGVWNDDNVMQCNPCSSKNRLNPLSIRTFVRSYSFHSCKSKPTLYDNHNLLLTNQTLLWVMNIINEPHLVYIWNEYFPNTWL